MKDRIVYSAFAVVLLLGWLNIYQLVKNTSLTRELVCRQTDELNLLRLNEANRKLVLCLSVMVKFGRTDELVNEAYRLQDTCNRIIKDVKN